MYGYRIYRIYRIDLLILPFTVEKSLKNSSKENNMNESCFVLNMHRNPNLRLMQSENLWLNIGTPKKTLPISTLVITEIARILERYINELF